MTSIAEGLTVLDLSQGMAGGMAGMVLADAGAEVIKIEPPGGDPTRNQPAWIMWNRGKKGVTLDLKTESGRRDLAALARVVDVMITSYQPRTAERLGASFEKVARTNPGLVYCSITGFGSLSKFDHLKGYDAIVTAKTGRIHAFDRQLSKDGPRYAALKCGTYGAAMYAISGIMAALHVRNRTGRGQKVETSLAQALFAYDWGWLQGQQKDVTTGPRPINRGSPTTSYFVARAKDGRWLQLANNNRRLLEAFIRTIGLQDVLGEPEYADLMTLVAGSAQDDLHGRIYQKIQEKTADEWMDLFVAEGNVGAEPFLTTQESFDHPQVRQHDLSVAIQDPSVGDTRQLAPLVKCSATPMSARDPAPSLGQHTKEVLAGLSSRKAVQSANGNGSPRYPLEGVSVLELATHTAAPFAGTILADLGADVIKVEELGGDPTRRNAARTIKSMQGKRSISIDLKRPEGQRIAHSLIEKADIMFHNFRPGVPQRLGIDYETARNVNHRIVYLYAGSYGSTGPYSHRPAFHPIPGAVCGGAMYQVGRSLAQSSATPMSIDEIRESSRELYVANEGNPDISAALAAASAMLLGLYARESTGQGQYLETTMLGSCLYAAGDDFIQYDGKPPRLLPDAELNGLHALYRFHQAKEGWVFLACVTDREWRIFCEAAGRSEMAGDPRFASRDLRLAHDGELAQEVGAIIAERPAAEWESFLSGHGVACAEVSDVDSAAFANAEPAMRESGMWVPSYHASIGDYYRYGGSITFSACENRLGPIVSNGEQTASILKELSYSDQEVQALKEQGVVTWPDA